MKRWILVRAQKDLTQVRRPKGRSFINRTPVWIDSHEGFDFYMKLVRQGQLEVLGEDDERPGSKVNQDAHPKADIRTEQAKADLEDTAKRIEDLEKELEDSPTKKKKKAITEALGVLKKTHENLQKEIQTLSEEE